LVGGILTNDDDDDDNSQSESGEVTDFCSFYHLPSTVIGNKLHNRLNAVYSYYNVATSVPLLDLMRDLLVVCK
jgi:glycylpeptide N-tetradecanoyltransferase